MSLVLLFGCISRTGGYPSPPDYRGIVPGRTMDTEVLAVLGEPTSRGVNEIDNVEEWGYYELRVSVKISLESRIVSWIHLRDQSNVLGDIVDKYGAPELVLVSAPGECWADEPTTTSLYYPQQGIEAILWRVPPLSRDFVITDLIYHEPMNLDASFELFGDVRECFQSIEWPGLVE